MSLYPHMLAQDVLQDTILMPCHRVDEMIQRDPGISSQTKKVFGKDTIRYAMDCMAHGMHMVESVQIMQYKYFALSALYRGMCGHVDIVAASNYQQLLKDAIARSHIKLYTLRSRDKANARISLSSIHLLYPRSVHVRDDTMAQSIHIHPGDAGKVRVQFRRDAITLCTLVSLLEILTGSERRLASRAYTNQTECADASIMCITRLVMERDWKCNLTTRDTVTRSTHDALYSQIINRSNLSESDILANCVYKWREAKSDCHYLIVAIKVGQFEDSDVVHSESGVFVKIKQSQDFAAVRESISYALSKHEPRTCVDYMHEFLCANPLILGSDVHFRPDLVIHSYTTTLSTRAITGMQFDHSSDEILLLKHREENTWGLFYSLSAPCKPGGQPICLTAADLMRTRPRK